MDIDIIGTDVNILLIDDDKLSGRSLQLQLKKKGYPCIHLTSGQEGLDYLEAHEVDLVLLDVMMPEISGLEVLAEIRKTRKSFEMPVIMVTSKDEAKDIVYALHRGANDYITKPVNVEIAMARINTQLQLKGLIEAGLASQKQDTIGKMVTTLNHEINNPLAIAMGNLTIAKDNGDLARLEKAMMALERIADIVKKIEGLSEQEDAEEVDYSSTVNMFKI